MHCTRKLHLQVQEMLVINEIRCHPPDAEYSFRRFLFIWCVSISVEVVSICHLQVFSELVSSKISLTCFHNKYELLHGHNTCDCSQTQDEVLKCGERSENEHVSADSFFGRRAFRGLCCDDDGIRWDVCSSFAGRDWRNFRSLFRESALRVFRIKGFVTHHRFSRRGRGCCMMLCLWKSHWFVQCTGERVGSGITETFFCSFWLVVEFKTVFLLACSAWHISRKANQLERRHRKVNTFLRMSRMSCCHTLKSLWAHEKVCSLIKLNLLIPGVAPPPPHKVPEQLYNVCCVILIPSMFNDLAEQ